MLLAVRRGHARAGIFERVMASLEADEAGDFDCPAGSQYRSMDTATAMTRRGAIA